MRELVIISGKGGTGKTSVAASFAVLADQPVIADCDVDAADLHLVLAPQIQERHIFRSGHTAAIRTANCVACGACLAHCRFGAVRKEETVDGAALFSIDPLACEGCGVCVRFCPAHAIDFPEQTSGHWMISTTRCGPMIHAQLRPGAGNSGKLVTLVRETARRVAAEHNYSLIIVDGPPGIGCPVIASLTGATTVLVVAEPTVAGHHDATRALSLARHFNIPAAICINKWDVNPELTVRIEKEAAKAGVMVAGRIRYDKAVTRAQLQTQAVVETTADAAADIRHVWRQLSR